jgi:hypothetical protein
VGRFVVILCGALVAASLLAVPAPASSRLQVGVADDAWLEFGPGTLEERAVRLRELGVQVARVAFDWRRIEAQQGTFDWTHTDAWLEALRAQRIAPLVTLWGTPGWANGGGGANIPPRSAATFAAFAQAAAQRYPWVRRWVVWNEPNQRRWLLPPSPAVYVTKLLNPAAAAIKSVIPGAFIAGGATAPRGGPGGTSPVDFIRGMARAGARLDVYAHHPHALSPAETPTTGGCASCSTITMATLDRLLSEVRTAFGARTRIWLTELGYQTNPPDRVLVVSWPTQARFVAEAQRRAYVAAGVDVLIQYLVRDEPRLDAWQSGLETVTGRAKPALASFSLPLAQVSRRGDSTTIWGQVRPGTGARRYLLQRHVDGSWKTMGGGSTTAAGYFTRTVRAGAGTIVRLFDPATGRNGASLVVT